MEILLENGIGVEQHHLTLDVGLLENNLIAVEPSGVGFVICI